MSTDALDQNHLHTVAPARVASIGRSVGLQRPHSEPAPHAAAIRFDIKAPSAIAALTVRQVIPRHEQTNIARHLPTCPHHEAER